MSIRVLFLCTGNSARSILAEALLKNIGGDAFDAHSAGTAPKGVNPYALEVMAARGVDASAATSNSVREFEGQSFDYVITLCDDAKESCPIFWGGSEYLHWAFEDPAAVEGSHDDKLAAFAAVAHGLEAKLEAFISTARAAARSV
jgi:arsenate reductase